MLPTKTALALLCLIAATASASAQQRGGISLQRSSPQAVADRIQSLQPGCPVAQTNVAVGTNRALGTGSTAQQQLVANNGGACRPLVSTQIAAGVNLALAPGASAGQSIVAQSPRGLLGTTNFARGTNIAAGRGAAAGQQILGLTGR
jgi:hypothetical protein